MEKIYIGTYLVFRVFKKSRRREIIRRGLTRQDAIKLVGSFSDKTTSMVCFDKQFYADKYYKNNTVNN